MSYFFKLVLYRALTTYRILCSSVRSSTINWNLGLRKIIQIPVVQRQGYLHYWMVHGYLLIAFYTIFARYLSEVTKSLFMHCAAMLDEHLCKFTISLVVKAFIGKSYFKDFIDLVNCLPTHQHLSVNWATCLKRNKIIA